MNNNPLFFLTIGLFFVVFFTSCAHTIRFYTSGLPDVFDYQNTSKDKDTIRVGVEKFEFHPIVKDNFLEGRKLSVANKIKSKPIEEIIAEKGNTVSFLIVQNDSIKYEKYFEKRKGKMDFPVNVFSVSKSFTATLLGIAIKEGYMKMDDPVQKYLPELNEIKELQPITLKDLVDMRSGLKHHEVTGTLNPNSRITSIYYGKEIYKVLMNRSRQSYERDKLWHYSSWNTSLLAIAIEKAVGVRFSEYLEKKIWIPLQMESDAYWLVDESNDRLVKGFCCLAATTRDLAKLGRLYLNNGEWNGVQILPKSFVEEAVRMSDARNGFYYSNSFRHNTELTPLRKWEKQNGKYPGDSKNRTLIKISHKTIVAEKYEDEDFFARGLLGNFVYVYPQNKTIIVRTGNSLTYGGINWAELMRAIAKREDKISNKYFKTTRIRWESANKF